MGTGTGKIVHVRVRKSEGDHPQKGNDAMTRKARILVVDDDGAHRTMLKALLGGWGYDVIEANDGAAAIEKVSAGPFDLVLMDIRMLKVSGIAALEQIKRINPVIPVILMTAYSSVETAVDALKKGAYDYLTKPLDFDRLRHTMQLAMEHVQLQEENRRLKQSIGEHFDRRNIIGSSPAMVRLLETVAQVAPTEATVLITGESGTGKELIAGALHANSERKNGPFVKVNCGALTETLLDAELFGHEKGAFTGAVRRKEGRFQQAHTGTIFLDEVSEMSPGMQVKLLRVLQERELTRVGGEAVVAVDVRVIAAANRNLTDLVAAGSFREDLFYRLNVIAMEMPPLRQRRVDIPLLAQHYLTILSRKNNKTVKGYTPAAMDLLIKYDWPGNVRELINAVEGAVILCRGEYLEPDDLPMAHADPRRGPASPPHLAHEAGMSLEDAEKAAILNAMEAAAGNKSAAARRLGITRKTLHKKLKLYGLMP
jgi:two-component system response regulator HydG